MTTPFGQSETSNPELSETPRPRHKYGWLPLLIVLFCVSYGLMTMLIVEQGATIESQRALIHELFRDSTELSASKMKAQQQKRAAQEPSALPKGQSPQTPSSQVPSLQVPSIQAPNRSVPSSQAMPQNSVKNRFENRPQFQTPSRPASDQSDDRRALIRI